MGSGQRFHLPTALRRGKSTARNQNWQIEGKDFKAQHILGITETALNTARNQSISSSATARIPALTFSDTTTELGSTATPNERHEDKPGLELKASSVLLHEEFQINGDNTNSIPSRRLKLYGSNSTLNSYYDAHKIPLAISQQTSDSSRRDFALRKGSPVVVKTPPIEKNSPLRFFRSSKSRDGHEPRKLTKSTPPPSDQHLPMTPNSQRSLTSNRGQGRTPKSEIPPVPTRTNKVSDSSRDSKGVHFYTLSQKPSVAPKQSQRSKASPTKTEIPHIKVNIRRPRAGAKHWFDGLEGDSSEEESIHEPEFDPSFVTGMEMAFEAGSIGTRSDTMSRYIGERSDQKDTKHKPRSMNHPPIIPPRVSTLNAKSSKSSMSQAGTARTGSKTKSVSLASTDLQKISVLDLSSSDDDEPKSRPDRPHNNSLPYLRDSIAIDTINESEIELGTAKAIKTNQIASIAATSNLRPFVGTQAKRKPTVASKRNSRAPTYLSDRSSDIVNSSSDLLTSFPPTPIDPIASQRTSCQGSDTASIESRRLMSVTRQEESLLAAMRSKRSALNQPGSRTTERKPHPLKGEDRLSRQIHQSLKSPAALEVLLSQQHKRYDFPPSNYPDQAFDQQSCTTFQTGPSVDPSVRLSIASYQTDTSLDTETEILSQRSVTSPSYHHHHHPHHHANKPTTATNNNNVNRTSRSTFFSSSSGTNESLGDQASSQSNHQHQHRLKQKAYRATLEKLQQVPTRDEVLSQDFIQWPYQGWEATSKLGTAH
ncbi:hypothetical protein LTR84_002206 [Exophiala bonariae]|uniref:DUF4045 domain-containing protein n=1 Tax=Exophiala bonariae TaxID=1690606 RepID=A0AAV9NAU1_9EURO|nr:hypothetical protein LTR84_002206 [Exophiala bonariae]